MLTSGERLRSVASYGGPKVNTKIYSYLRQRNDSFSSLKDREALYFAFMGDTCLNTCSGAIHMETKQCWDLRPSGVIPDYTLYLPLAHQVSCAKYKVIHMALFPK